MGGVVVVVGVGGGGGVTREGSYTGGIDSHPDVACGQNNSRQPAQVLLRAAPHVSG